MNSKSWHVSGVLILALFLIFTVSCEKTGTTDDGGTTNQTNDAQVHSISLSFDRSSISSFLGRVDTVMVTAKALDENQVGIENVEVAFSLLDDSPGALIEIDTITSTQGDYRAYYVLELRSEAPQVARIKAEVIAAGQDVVENIPITAKDIVVSITARNDFIRAAFNDSVGTDLTVRVTDISGVGINAIPVRVEKISGTDDATLTPVNETGVTGTTISNLDIQQLVKEEVVQVIAYVDVPTFKATPTKGVGVLKDRLGSLFRGSRDANQAELDGAGGSGRFMSSVLSDTVTVTMTTYNGLIDSVYLYINPHEMTIPEDSSGVATVYAIAFDESKVGIPNLQFHFSIEDTNTASPSPTGRITSPVVTDTSGEARSTIHTSRQFGTWWILAAAGADTFRTQMTVNVAPGLGGDLAIIATPSSIYADMGITRAQVTATLKDNNQSAVVNDTIKFAAIGGGSIEGFAITDDHGVATATFIDDGSTGTTQIIARYSKGNLNLFESVDVVVLENRIIEELLLFTPGTQYQVSMADSFEYRVNVRYDSGELAVVGTPVNFETSTLTGASFDPNIAICDDNGVARTSFYPGTTAGTDTVFARAGEGQIGGEVHSLHIPVEITPVDPSNIQNLRVFNLDGSEFYTNQRDAGIVTCVVQDTFFNSVNDGFTVNFTSTIGTVTPSGRTVTHEDPPGSGNWLKGFVQVSYTPGTQAGQARVIARSGNAADSSDIMIHSGRPQALNLSANLQKIAARGTGGVETARLTASVTDPNGNPVENETLVFFNMDLFPPPRGQDGANPSINESDGTEPGNFYHQPFDSSSTNNGTAMVSINSGSSTGLVRIRAWTHIYPELVGTPDADSVVAIFTGLAIVAGPPAFAEIDVNEIGEDGGGAIWNVEVSARISDFLNNPVADSIAVQFEIIAGDEGNNGQATIGDGFTGNEDVSGEVSPGVANTIMSYHSAATNDSVEIEASLVNNNIRGTYPDFNLPIQEAAGVLYGDPTNWNFRNQPAPAVFDMSVFVYDGHDHCIDDQLVRFLTDRGLYYTAAAGGQVRNEAMTGPRDYPVGLDGDICGWAHRYLRITFDDAFPDPRILETTATANVEIIGYPDAAVEPVTLNLMH
ncbi:MAG: Ig-like domain-containing protein [Candidatus Electryonea clarkiae]|nr:Ig-like domain-containing protein [Candidatus Electryonea clarkiae]MDP8288686.1 Ig-like domain-containing protein [Candidatus Electryonea clarkiae]